MALPDNFFKKESQLDMIPYDSIEREKTKTSIPSSKLSFSFSDLSLNDLTDLSLTDISLNSAYQVAGQVIDTGFEVAGDTVANISSGVGDGLGRIGLDIIGDPIASIGEFSGSLLNTGGDFIDNTLSGKENALGNAITSNIIGDTPIKEIADNASRVVPELIAPAINSLIPKSQDNANSLYDINIPFGYSSPQGARRNKYGRKETILTSPERDWRDKYSLL